MCQKSWFTRVSFEGKFQDNEQVECVIIGGGVLGGSMLYHLTKAGKLILLQKFQNFLNPEA